MKSQFFPAFALLLSLAMLGQSSQPPAPQIVEIPSGNLHLKGYLWKPAGPGPFPAVLFNHGSGTDAVHTAGITVNEAAEKLAPLFVKHGYALLFPCRRGQGLSADQAPFMRDLLKHEEEAKGKEARVHLQFVLMSTEQLDDVLASLAFLKNVPGIDPHRIAVAGHSFGGQLTLLAAERDLSVRAAVTFGAATWLLHLSTSTSLTCSKFILPWVSPLTMATTLCTNLYLFGRTTCSSSSTNMTFVSHTPHRPG